MQYDEKEMEILKRLIVSNVGTIENSTDPAGSLYEIGSEIRLFSLHANSNGEITGVGIKKPGDEKPTFLPNFMGIKPSIFSTENTTNIIFLIGTEPCDLQRLMLSINSNDQTFSFKIDIIFENCTCDKQAEPEENDCADNTELQVQAPFAVLRMQARAASDGVRGGGTWPH